MKLAEIEAKAGTRMRMEAAVFAQGAKGDKAADRLMFEYNPRLVRFRVAVLVVARNRNRVIGGDVCWIVKITTSVPFSNQLCVFEPFSFQWF